MMTIREYKRAESLEEAWQLNQKKPNRILGGMIWLKMETINVGTAIDLSGLGLDTIEENEEGFSIGRYGHPAPAGTAPGACRLHPRRYAGGCAPYRGRAAAQSGYCGRQHLQPVRLFGRADHVPCHGL